MSHTCKRNFRFELELSSYWQNIKFSHKIGKGNLNLTENQLSSNEMCCAADNHNNICHTRAKEFLDSNLN